MTEAEWIGTSSLIMNARRTLPVLSHGMKEKISLRWDRSFHLVSGISPESFWESFPKLLAFLNQKVVLPDNLKLLSSKHAPWKTREEFMSGSAGLKNGLRMFLAQTQNYQAEFLSERFVKSIPSSYAVPIDSRNDIQKN